MQYHSLPPFHLRLVGTSSLNCMTPFEAPAKDLHVVLVSETSSSTSRTMELHGCGKQEQLTFNDCCIAGCYYCRRSITMYSWPPSLCTLTNYFSPS